MLHRRHLTARIPLGAFGSPDGAHITSTAPIRLSSAPATNHCPGRRCFDCAIAAVMAPKIKQITSSVLRLIVSPPVPRRQSPKGPSRSSNRLAHSRHHRAPRSRGFRCCPGSRPNSGIQEYGIPPSAAGPRDLASGARPTAASRGWVVGHNRRGIDRQFRDTRGEVDQFPGARSVDPACSAGVFNSDSFRMFFW